MGALRHGPQQGGAARGARPRSRSCASEFWRDVTVLGERDSFNQSLEKAGRVADFLEFGELMCRDALDPRGELRRPLPRRVPGPTARPSATTSSFCHVAAWEYKGDGKEPMRHIEPLVFENVKLATRSYK